MWPEDEPSGDKELNCPCCGSHLFLVGRIVRHMSLGRCWTRCCPAQMARTRAFEVGGTVTKRIQRNEELPIL